MIREKSLIRKQICLAINKNDFETARNMMSTICAEEVFRRRNWSEDDTEYLMQHVSSLGYDEAIKRVAKKLKRTQLSAKKKYASEIRKLKGRERLNERML